MPRFSFVEEPLVLLAPTNDEKGYVGSYDLVASAEHVHNSNGYCIKNRHAPRCAWHVPSAPQTIDHGRLDTLKRRKAFSTVHTELRNARGELMFEFPTDTMLSPRRITRIIQAHRFTAGWSKRNHGDLAADVADAAYKLLCSFRDNGYTLPDVLEQRVRLMRVRLVANDAA